MQPCLNVECDSAELEAVAVGVPAVREEILLEDRTFGATNPCSTPPTKSVKKCYVRYPASP